MGLIRRLAPAGLICLPLAGLPALAEAPANAPRSDRGPAHPVVAQRDDAVRERLLGPERRADRRTAPRDVVGVTEGGLGAELWRGLSARALDELIRRLPEAPRSRILRTLARRALLTAALRPDEIKQTDLLNLRLDRLYAMGDLDGVARLWALNRGADRPTLRPAPVLGALLLSGRTDPACEAARAFAAHRLTGFVERSLIVCHVRQGRHDRAALGVSVMRDQGQAPEAAFATLVAAAAGAARAPGQLDRPGPLTVALLAAGDFPLPEVAVETLSPPLLRGLVASGKPPRAPRIAAGERLALINALPDGTLAALYAGATLRREAIDSARAIRLADYGRGARLRLYQAAAFEEDLDLRMLILAAWWRLASAAGDEPLTARLTAPLLKNIRPVRRWQDSAAHIARVYFWTGRLGRALDWYRLLRDAPFRNPDDLYRLTAVAALAGEAQEDGLRGWYMHNLRREGVGAAEIKARRLHALLDGLGDAAAGFAFWPPRADTTGTRRAGLDPAWLAIDEAAAAGRRGETLLRLIAAVDEWRLDRIPAPAFETAVSALRRVGLEDEARTFAVEVALRTGL